MSREKWRPVPFGKVRDIFGRLRNLRPLAVYEASTAGRIKRDGVIVSEPGREDRYKTVHVPHSTGVCALGVHRLVALAFVPIPSTAFLVVNHKNLKKGDNRPQNLEWATRAEDAQHAMRLGARRTKTLFQLCSDCIRRNPKLEPVSRLFKEGHAR